MTKRFDELTKGMAQSFTRREALRRLSLGFAGLGLAKFGLQRAEAITNGQLDGDGHPNVGGFVWLKNIWSPDPPPAFVGTGSLIHPRVILTAGHGTHAIESAIADGTMTIGDVLFSFASDAKNPATWRAISGVITHPSFDSTGPVLDGAGNIPLADVGVAILQEPATDLPVTPLPALGFLDALNAAGQLRAGSDRAKFTLVGDGTVLGPTPNNWPFPPDGIRRVAVSEFRNLHERWLFLNQNPVQGLGGSGLGDSGGPTYWIDPLTGQSTLVALVSRGASDSFGVNYRVDTVEALSFLNQVLTMAHNGQL